MKATTRALWELLLTDFSQFEDYRNFKADMGGNAPEFKHIESGEGLWWDILIDIVTLYLEIGVRRQAFVVQCRNDAALDALAIYATAQSK